MLQHTFKWLLFLPTLAGSMRGFFSDTHCENLVELLEVNVVGFFLRLGYPAVLTLRDNLTEHPAICQIQFPFSSWALDATAVFTHESLLQ